VKARGAVALVLAAIAFGCGGPTPAPAVTAPPPPSDQQKLEWILELEDQRVARGPAPGQDLVMMLGDSQGHIRRRAAHAAGRVRLVDAVPELSKMIATEVDPEIRQMAAFALGLIGDPGAAEALTPALAGADPLLQGRAAEALGRIGGKEPAAAIGAMMTAHVSAGVLSQLAADDVGYPKSAEIEAVRLGLYALVRLGAYDVLASTMLDSSGQPRSRWWPVAYAFQRIGDARAAPVLMSLLSGDGQVTRAFAARGLATLEHEPAAPVLVKLAANAAEAQAVRVQAVRAIGAIGNGQGADALRTIIATPKVDPNLQLEATFALGELRQPSAVDMLTDLASHSWAPIRGAALIGLARSEPDTFVGVLSALGRDPEWSVRVSLAAALAELGERGVPRLQVMLEDEDQRVIPAVLNALAQSGDTGAVAALTAKLTSDDPVVRMAAARGLATLKATGAVEALMAALDRSASDGTYVARAAILGALTGLDPAAARARLVAALSDKDWAVRVRAAELLREVDPSADSTIAPAPPPAIPELADTAALLSPAFSPMAYIDTPKGMVQIELAIADAPRTVANFIALTRKGFFDGFPLHRVVPDFVVQGGDPRGDGEGGPGYTIRDEINQRPYNRGTVGMALDWADTGGSQFFITHSPQPHLDGRYTAFGEVVEGMDVVDRLSQWDLVRTVRVWDGVSWIGASVTTGQ
jgi:cyclophilin family peptidyl-prolyl cis-trans isomerase/HEAT repeat protein